jgi:putative transposase
MSRNYYSEINLHITWHTKVEAIVRHCVRGKCINTPGVFIHEIGGTETHVHVCVSIAPTVEISEFIGQLKGASSHDVNAKLGRKVLEWQAGYGVVSFGMKDLEWVKRYVREQPEHHARGTVYDRLERITALEEAEAEPREAP